MNSIICRLTIVCRANAQHSVSFAERQLLVKRGVCVSPKSCFSLEQNNNNKSSKKPATKSNEASRWGSKKAHRKVKLNVFSNMTDSKTEEILAPLRLLVKEQVFLFVVHFD